MLNHSECHHSGNNDSGDNRSNCHEHNNNYKSKRVLVADDEEINQMLLKKFLEGLGFQVTIATCGEEGIQYFKEEPFPYIFVDFNMPRMNGPDMVAEIRNLEKELAPYVTPYIVGITSNNDPDFLKAGLKAGMDRVYNKPILKEIIETIFVKHT